MRSRLGMSCVFIELGIWNLGKMKLELQLRLKLSCSYHLI